MTAPVQRILSERLDGVVAGLVSGEPSAPRAAVARLEVPAIGFAHAAAAGLARDGGPAMRPETPFHIASIGKLFTAAMILQLAEEGRLGPDGADASLGSLGVLEPALLDRLHVMEGVSRGPAITLRQILTHTSGLCDAFGDDAKGTAAQHGGPAPGALSVAFWKSLKARATGAPLDPDHAARRWIGWDPARPEDREAGLMNHYVAELGSAPAARPGERFHYSDNGFVLLALLIERLGGESYEAAQRRRLITPLGLTHTWMSDREPRPAAWDGPECDVWINGIPILASGANLSFDWGGGGQVSNAEDLCRLGLQIWASPASGAPMIGHAGAWGVHLWRDPRTGATLAGTVNQRHDPRWAFDLLDAVHDQIGDVSA
jgi:D-alanyl-D-alanine carboxypeptidase